MVHAYGPSRIPRTGGNRSKGERWIAAPVGRLKKRGFMITDLKVNADNKREYYAKGYWTEKTLNDRWNETVAA